MITGTASGTIGVNGSATACNGFGSGLMAVAVAVVLGVTGIVGSASGSVAVAGAPSRAVESAAGTVAYGGTATGTVGIVGTAAGIVRVAGTAQGVNGVTGSAAGTVACSGAPAVAVGIVGSGTGNVALASPSISQALAATYQAVAVNAKGLGGGLYASFAFDCLWQGADGHYYGGNSAGIWRLTGTRDGVTDVSAGSEIATVARSGVSNLGTHNRKYVTDGFLTVRNEGEMQLTVTMDETVERTYPVEAREGRQGMHVKRRQLAKGLRCGVVQVEVRNVAGADNDLAALELTAVPTGRT